LVSEIALLEDRIASRIIMEKYLGIWHLERQRLRWEENT
jgi:hypothetical protein